MTTKLPPELLGLLSPILSLVEHSGEYTLPEHWREDPVSRYTTKEEKKKRERGWLMQELATASVDTIGGIISTARGRPRHPVKKSSHLDPPADFVITKALNRLADYFFVWVGNELVIRDGRLGELHIIARRFPVSNIIRFAYALTSVHDYLHEKQILQRPTRLGYLNSNFHSLRVEVNKGLFEGHLHLTSLLSPDDSWIEDMFSHPWPGNKYLLKEERRLSQMGRICVGIATLALGYYWLQNQVCEFKKVRDDGKVPCIGKDCKKLIDLHLLKHPCDVEPKTDKDRDWIKECPDCHIDLGPLWEGNRRFYQQQEVHLPWPEITKLLYRLDTLYQATDEMSFMELGKRLTEAFRVERGHLFHNLMLCPTNPPDWLSQLLTHSVKLDQSSVQYKESLMNQFQMYFMQALITGRELQRGHALDFKPKSRQWTGRKKSKHDVSEEEGLVCLERIAFRYFVFQTHHWHRMTQHGKTTGLDFFNELRKSGHRRKAVDRSEYCNLAIKHSCESQSLKGLEGRIGPPGSARDLKPWVLGFMEQYRRKNVEQFGLIVHFKKSGIDRYGKSPNPLATHIRYGKVRRMTRAKALRMFRVLGSGNSLVPFIVGLDAASLELNAPPEVFAPAFRFLRDQPIEPTRNTMFDQERFMNEDLKRGYQGRRLNVTYHVGEDFRHILSGLRAIVEAVDFLNMQPGDRLGHAIALGLNARKWLEDNGGQVALSKQEWLDNLVWLHHILSGEKIVHELELEDLIQALSREIYHTADFDSAGGSSVKLLKTMQDQLQEMQRLLKDQHPDFKFENTVAPPIGKPKSWERDWPIPTLYDAWRLRQLDPLCIDVNKLMEYRFQLTSPSGWGREHKRWHSIQRRVHQGVDKLIGSNAAFRLLALYWYDQDTAKRGDKYESIDMSHRMDDWLKLIEMAQDKVRNFLRRRQIVVEVCPSSNLLIGPMNDLRDHQVYNLTLDENYDLKHELKVTVNTDNPGLLETSLDHEYYLLAEALIKEGAPELKVLQWLSWLRRNGEDCSFLGSAPRPERMMDFFERNKDAFYRSAGKDARFFWQRWAERQMEERKALRQKDLERLLLWDERLKRT